MKKKSCILTFVRNGKTFLPIWLKYYSCFFEKEDIYVIDHGSDDGSIEDCRRQYAFNLTTIPFVCYDCELAITVCKNKQVELLQFYESVLLADPDEIIIPNPKKYRDLKDYISRNSHDCVACTGYELIHLRKKESPIDLSKPILEQRKYWYQNYFYNKPLLARVPLSWATGFHTADNSRSFTDPDLWLLHLHRWDFDLCRQAHEKVADEEWSAADIEKGRGFQFRLGSPEEFIRFFDTRHPDYAKLETNKLRVITTFIKAFTIAKVFKASPALSYKQFIMQHPVITRIPGSLRKNGII